jgi:TolB protein
VAGGRSAPTRPSWSPDGSKLVYALDHDAPGGEDVDLYVVDADGTHNHRITRGSRHDAEATPAWSPDGRRIAYTRGNGTAIFGLSVVRPDGGGKVALTFGCELDPAWAPDSSQLVYGRCGDGLFVVDANGKHARRLTRPPPPQDDFDYADIEPAWSPDGRTIAFVRDASYEGRGGGDIWTLWVVGRDGNRARQLTNGSNDQSPTWSPDGRAIAFMHDYEVWAIRPDGTHEHRLFRARRAWLDEPAWQPG